MHPKDKCLTINNCQAKTILSRIEFTPLILEFRNLDFGICTVIFIPNSPVDAAQACAIFKVGVPVFFHGIWRAAGAYGYDGEDFCAEKEGPYRG